MIVTSKLRLPLLGALLGLHLASQAATSTPAAIVFDTTPRAGQQQRQTMDMRATMKMRAEAGPDATDEQRAKAAQAAERMAQGGDVKMHMQMLHTTRVGQPDAQGWLPLSFVSGTKEATVEAGGQQVPMPNNPAGDLTLTARFNPKDFSFELLKVEGGRPEMSQMMSAQGQALISDAFKLHKALAQRSLKIGDSVDVPLNLSLPVPLPGGAGAMQGLVHYTLKRVERGVAYFDLSMTLNANIETPLPTPPATAASGASAPADPPASAAAAGTPPAAPRVLRMAMTGSGQGTSSLRLTDRLPLDTQLGMDMKMTVDGPDNMRMLFDMTMDMASKGEALGLRSAPAKKKP